MRRNRSGAEDTTQREPQCGIAEQRDDLADRYLIKGGIHGDVLPRYDSFVHTYRLEVCM